MINLPEELMEVLKNDPQFKDMIERTAARIKKRNDVLDFLNSGAIRKRLERFMYATNTNLANFSMQINPEGQSYTDGRVVAIGIPELFWGEPKEVLLIIAKAMVGHELGHINFSDFRIFVDFQKWAENYFMDNYSVSGAGRVSASLLNCTEDGRIERAQANEMRGLIKFFKFLNMAMYDDFTEEKMGQIPLHDFMNSVLTLSKMGMEPQGFHKMTGTDVEAAIDVARPHIINAIRSETAKACMEETKAFMIKNADLLAEWMKPFDKEIEENQDGGSGQDGQSGDNQDGEGGNGQQAQSGERSAAGSQGNGANGAGQESKEQSGQAGQGSAKKTVHIDPTQDLNTDPGYSGRPQKKKANQGSTSTHFKDEEETKKPKAGQDASQGAEKGGKGQEEGTAESQAGENPHGQGAASAQAEGSPQSQANEQSDDWEVGEGVNESDMKDGFVREADSNANVDAAKENDSIKEALNTLLNDLKEEHEDAIRQSEKEDEAEAARQRAEKKEQQAFQLNPRELSACTETEFDSKGFRYTDEMLDNVSPLPNDIKLRGAKFNKDLKKILLDKKGYTRNNQRAGRLDVNALWRMSTAGETDIFIKKGEPRASDYVVSILVDNSGSMSSAAYDEAGNRIGSKVEMAREACAVLEEGLRGLIPFKIQRFDTRGGTIVHREIRGWQHKGKENKAWSATSNTGGGNADGYSIKVAVEELKKRPETQKILFVLSDGLPSDYRSDTQAFNHVNRVVSEARKEGIKVVAIRFGSESVLKDSHDGYHKMYTKDYLTCLPHEITKELTRTLKRITQ